MARTDSRTRSTGYPRPARTGLIALTLPALSEPYFAELASGFLAAAADRGLSMVLAESRSDRDREVDIVNGVGLPAVDGLIHVPRALRVADLTRRSAPGPLVLLGEPAPGSPFSHVTIDNEGAGRLATEHLLESGCAQVAMIGVREETPSEAADRRYAGYCSAIAGRGGSVEPALVATVSEFSPEEGERAIGALLAAGHRPDGVVCASDSLALGVLAGLADAGPRVRVVGIDDIHQGRFTTPTLSSISPDKDALVAESMRLLQAQIQAPPALDPPVEQVVIGTRLVVRASTR